VLEVSRYKPKFLMIGMRHPDQGTSGRYAFQTESGEHPFPGNQPMHVAYALFTDDAHPLPSHRQVIIGLAKAEVDSVAFETASGSVYSAEMFDLPPEYGFRAFVVAVEAPGDGIAVGRGSTGETVYEVRVRDAQREYERAAREDRSAQARKERSTQWPYPAPKGDEEACAICGYAFTSPHQIASSPKLPDVKYHLGCPSTVEGRVWQADLEREHPAVERERRLRTFRHPVRCGRCGLWQALSPTPTGLMSPPWDGNCDSCFRHRPLVNGYESRELWSRLHDLKRHFLDGEWSDGFEAELTTLDTEVADRPTCECGGEFSLAARPRCRRCTAVMDDSFFSVVMGVASTYSPSDGADWAARLNMAALRPDESGSKAFLGDAARWLARRYGEGGMDAVTEVTEQLTPEALRHVLAFAAAGLAHTQRVLPDAPLRDPSALDGVDPKRTGGPEQLP
jgi:hypothetical protein